MGKRMRGRAGMEARARRLADHPTCAECAKRGLVRATEVIDHIKALALGGEDVDSNVQGLCHSCHAIKTALESPSAEAVSNHPTWLRPAIRPLTIVCGPPCSGKSTYVAERASGRDVVVDLDAIMAIVQPGYRPWTLTDPAMLNRAMRVRNELLGSLSNRPGRVAWFVIAAPTLSERMWWKEQLGGSIVLLDPGQAVCIERAGKRGTPGAVPGIRRWYADARGVWSGPAKRRPPRQAFDADGYPIVEE